MEVAVQMNSLCYTSVVYMCTYKGLLYLTVKNQACLKPDGNMYLNTETQQCQFSIEITAG